jgi:spore maturation protein CgeB
MIEPSVIDQIRKTGVPTCNFSCNNVHQFQMVDDLSPHFDFNLHAEKDVKEKFISIGANPIWWPMASNPKYFKPKDIKRVYDVTFVGANYALRSQYITHLLVNNIDVHAFGPKWNMVGRTKLRNIVKRLLYTKKTALASSLEEKVKSSTFLSEFDLNNVMIKMFPYNFHSSVSDEELINLYSSSNISLGFLEVFDRHDPSRPVMQHLHLREFEAPMCGALYITGYMKELEEFFEPEKEIITYRNRYELLDKVNYYLVNPEKGEKIRQAGYRRAITQHSYHNRFRMLFKQIGLEGK